MSSENIDLSVLSPQLREVFQPLLEELEDLGEPLDRDEFVDASLRLYQRIPQLEKTLILQFGKRKHKHEESVYSFKPKVNS